MWEEGEGVDHKSLFSKINKKSVVFTLIVFFFRLSDEKFFIVVQAP